MSDEDLRITMAGNLAARVRAAADASGVDPVRWVVQAVAAQLPGAESRSTQSAPGPAAAPGTPEALSEPGAWEQVVDASGTFTVELPRGWQHQTQLLQGPNGNKQVVTATSPDGGTTITNGDPQLPLFILPGGFAMPGAVLRQPTPAEQFSAEYLHHNFGQQPGFRILEVRQAPQFLGHVQQLAQRENIPLTWATTAQVLAELNDGGQRRTLLALVMTAGITHSWYATVGHVMTTGAAADYAEALFRVMASTQATPQEKQRLLAERMRIDAQHQATMGNIAANTQMMTARHQQNMANIQASGQAHQARMAAMQGQWDSQFQSWQQQQASMDNSHNAFMTDLRQESPAGGVGGASGHHDFLNMIKEERTVVDAQGWERQVEAGPDKYYHREHDDSWIGLQQHEDIHDVPGINPDDYYETPIKS